MVNKVSQIKAIQDEMKDLASENLGSAFQKLRAFLDKDKLEFYNDYLQQYARFREAEKTAIKGIASRNQYLKEINSIRVGLFSLIDTLKEEYLSPTATLEDEIYARILVCSKNQACTDEMKSFYIQRFFKNVVYVPDVNSKLNVSEVIKDKKYDFIVFNLFGELARPLKPEDAKWSEEAENHYTVLEDSLKNVDSLFVVYYGGMLNVLNSNRTKAHACNSPFALHARTREMIDYLKYHPK